MRLRLVVLLSVVAIGLGVTGFFVRESRVAAPRPTPTPTEVVEETPETFDTTPLPGLDLDASPLPTAAPAAAVEPATRRPVVTARPATPVPTPKPKKTPPPFPFSPLPTRSPTAAPTEQPPT